MTTVIGAICEGRSGGPLFLLTENYELVRKAGKAVVVGEVEGPGRNAPQNRDPDTGLMCAQRARANLVS